MFTDDAGSDFVLNASSGATAGIPGNIYEDLLFYVDPADRNSYPSTGTTVTDLMGNATNGTLTAVTFEDGAFNYDATTNTRLSFTKGAPLDNLFATGGTVMVWVRLADDGQAANGILIDTSGDADAGWYISTISVSAGHLTFRFQRHYSGTSGATFTADNITQPWSGGTDRPIHKANWTSICITFDDSLTAQPGMYVNGTAVTVTTNTGISGSPQSDAGNPITLGNIGTNFDQCMDGQLGVVMMWDRTLAADEIQRAHSSFSVRYGQGIRGGDGKLIGSNGFADMSGQDIWIRGGDSTTSSNEAEGGHIYLIAGNNAGGGSAAAGRIYIASGSGTGNVGGSGDILIESGQTNIGSAVTIQVGDQNTGGTPDVMTVRGGDNYHASTGGTGQVFIRSGAHQRNGSTGALITVRGADGNDPSSPIGSMSGGAAVFRAGDGRGGGSGGALTVRAGNTGPTGGSGGSVTMSSGTVSAGNSSAGDFTITTGSTPGAGDPGDFILTTGSATGTAPGGDVLITTGNTAANFNNFTGGNFVVTTGNSTSSSSNSNNGGGSATFTLGTSNKTNTNSPGGGFFVTAGAGVANSANSRGGAIQLTAGAITGTTAGAVAGSVTITSGSITSTTGTPGNITLTPGTDTGSAIGDIILSYATWPSADGSSGQVLTTNGAGALSWGAAGGILRAGQEGALYNGITFYIDTGDRTSYSGSGTTVYDLINETTGTISGVQIVEGHFNWNAATDDINFGTVVASETEDIFDAGGTIEFWVRPETDGFGAGGIIATTADDTTTEGWTLRVDTQSGTTVNLSFLKGASTSQGIWTASGALQVGQWYHIVVTYDDDSATNDPLFYINGTSAIIDIDTNPGGTIGSDSGNTLFVGGNTGGTQGWEGDIEIGRFWNRTLSANEVQQLYQIGQDRFRPSLYAPPPSTVLTNSNAMSITLKGADGAGTGDGSAITGTGGAGGATGDGGNITWTGGLGGSTSGTGGSVTAAGGAAGVSGGTAGDFLGIGGAGNSSIGGTAYLTGGAGSGANAGGSARVDGGSGGSTGNGGTAVVEGGAGGGSSGNGGQSTLKGGDASAGNGDGGIALVRGGNADGSGTNGAVALVTTSTDAPVGMLTTGTTFQGTVLEHFTFGSATTLSPSSSQDLVTLGTIASAGHNMKFEVYATGVDSGSVGDGISHRFIQSYWSDSGGTISAFTAHLDNNAISSIAGFSLDVTFSLVISGSNILLRATNTNGSTTYTGYFSVWWTRQEGGFGS